MCVCILSNYIYINYIDILIIKHLFVNNGKCSICTKLNVLLFKMVYILISLDA